MNRFDVKLSEVVGIMASLTVTVALALVGGFSGGVYLWAFFGILGVGILGTAVAVLLTRFIRRKLSAHHWR
jgi:hypothetical protein